LIGAGDRCDWGGIGVVATENLDVAKLTRSAKGTVEEPGTNVKQKSEPNRRAEGPLR
jgi:hypothetical protein